jgi:arylsulfatase A-like enzyme
VPTRTTEVGMTGVTPPSAAPAATSCGLIAGTLVASAYAALELLVQGPLTMSADELIGPWYIGAVFPYVIAYAALGALIGAVVGFLLGRAGRLRHHVSPTLATLLMLVFVGNAWLFGFGLTRTPYLPMLVPVALWLLAGLLFLKESPARSFVGSPWPAALVTLAPLALSRGDVINFGEVGNTVAAWLVIGIVALKAVLAQRRDEPSRPPSWKPQAVVTATVILAAFGLMRMLAVEPAAAQQQSQATDRPNVVLIVLDTTRADRMSLYGHEQRTTPRLEAFASHATLYRHAYAAGDMTLSSHASLFTGLYPTQHGGHLDTDTRRAIAATVPTLAELLRKAGYRNYGSVANPVYLDPVYGFARGFDEWHMPRPLAVVSPEQGTYLLRKGVYKLLLPWVWTEALRLFVPASTIASSGETLLAESEDEPFFLFLNFMDSHRPWLSSGEFRTRFPGYDQTFDEVALRSVQPEVIAGRRSVSPEEAAKMGAAYDGSLAYLDDIVGRMLDRFGREPWYDGSLIVVTADHGEQLGEKNQIDHGNGVDHGLTSIPLIVKFPGQKDAREVRSPVSQVDVFSTIAAVAGATVPGPRAGVDLAVGDPGEERSIIIESYPFRNFIRDNPVMDRMERALVKGRWKFISSTRGRRELYDMVSDPTESTNLASSHTDVAADLERRLEEWTVAAEKQRPPATLPAGDQDLLQRMRALGYLQ